jgi:hypothetical protein
MSRRPRSIKPNIQKMLFSRSYGQCNLCGVSDPSPEIAHIIAHSANGPRANVSYEYENINSYNNLILLCPNCHTMVDKNPQDYPESKLHEIKAKHEESISQRLSVNSPQRNNDIWCIQQLIDNSNFCSIPQFMKLLPTSVDLRLLDFEDVLKCLEDMPHIYPFNDSLLQEHLNKFIICFNELWEWISGYTPYEGVRSQYANYVPQYPHFSQAEGYPPIIRRLYENISYKRNQEIDEAICIAHRNLLKSYHEFIHFIRGNYPEVRL